MAFGDYLRKHLYMLSKSTIAKNSSDPLWMILRKIAVHDILDIYPHKVDSDIAVPIYYSIIKNNENYLPKYYTQKLKSNNQERYRVIVRNLFTSNAFHIEGLANQKEINAYKEINESKKGERIVYVGVDKYVGK